MTIMTKFNVGDYVFKTNKPFYVFKIEAITIGKKGPCYHYTNSEERFYYMAEENELSGLIPIDSPPQATQLLTERFMNIWERFLDKAQLSLFIEWKNALPEPDRELGLEGSHRYKFTIVPTSVGNEITVEDLIHMSTCNLSMAERW